MIHIQRYIERLQGFEARGQRDFMMSIKDAKDLHADITKLLLTLETLREQQAEASKEQVVQVEMGGGSF
jgi:hypothetical protein